MAATGICDGRVAIVTGAGRGIGRGHALELARQGARVVVNDLGGGVDGTGADRGPAEAVVDEIRANGGDAIANGDDVSSWAGAEALVSAAIATFGRLDVVVNNAGILRDRMLVNMTEQEWDSVIRVHLKGTFAPTRFAAAYWRERSKAGDPVDARVINTSSTSGLFANPGQTNYGAAKSGIATFSEICAKELVRYGVRVNAIAPAARTRLTESTPGLADVVAPPAEPGKFDIWDPANVSPLVAWLATQSCPATGKVFYVQGGRVAVFRPWTLAEEIERDDRWTVSQLEAEMPKLLG